MNIHAFIFLFSVVSPRIVHQLVSSPTSTMRATPPGDWPPESGLKRMRRTSGDRIRPVDAVPQATPFTRLYVSTGPGTTLCASARSCTHAAVELFDGPERSTGTRNATQRGTTSAGPRKATASICSKALRHKHGLGSVRMSARSPLVLVISQSFCCADYGLSWLQEASAIATRKRARTMREL